MKMKTGIFCKDVSSMAKTYFQRVAFWYVEISKDERFSSKYNIENTNRISSFGDCLEFVFIVGRALGQWVVCIEYLITFSM